MPTSARKDAAGPLAKLKKELQTALRAAPKDTWAEALASVARLGRKGVDALREAAVLTVKDPKDQQWLRKCIEHAEVPPKAGPASKRTDT